MEAHIDAVSVLGGPCGQDKMFDFGQQDITKRIENIIPVMLKVNICLPCNKNDVLNSLRYKFTNCYLYPNEGE